jgi:NitT/TauT family transport system permease protein
MKPKKRRSASLFRLQRDVPGRASVILTALSFALPILLWCIVSYVPFIWHPMRRVIDPGDVNWLVKGELVEGDAMDTANGEVLARGGRPARGTRSNPVFLPAPHEVVSALVTGFTTHPARPDEPWLHQSLWHSIQVIFWGFVISSIFGVPLGILCGAMPAFARLNEPFIEFFRYLPAPAFGALCVAVLGIHDPPKIAIIFIGTFFQQVLVVANTTRKLDGGLLEAASTLGASKRKLLTRVVIPGIVVDLYCDARILLGWAWTYLIVAELVGTTSGITYFINQQARYRHFDNVYAAIGMIGIIGLTCDIVFAWLGTVLFPWKRRVRKAKKLTFTGVPAMSAEAMTAVSSPTVSGNQKS